MLGKTYKKILDAMPAGVFVFDGDFRVLFTNAAFRRSFLPSAKRKGSLQSVIACGNEGKCGSGDGCAFCSLKRAMVAAKESGEEQTATAIVTLPKAERTDKITVRIRIYPADRKGNLFLGLTDGSYQTEMANELLSAKKMQQRLLPVGKSMGGVPYSYMYIPCLEVGGDLPDVYELSGQTYGVISDVSGKGVSAGMLSAFVKAGFDHKERSLANALNMLSAKFSELNLDERSYITLAAVRICKEEGKIRFVSAGHNAPVLLKTDVGINEIETPAPPVSNWISEYVYKEGEIPYQRGDILVLLTDGVTECKNKVGELFGIERAESVLLQARSAEDYIGKLRSALTVFSGGKFSDDVTAIAFDL